MPVFGIVASLATVIGGAFTFLSGGGALASIVKMGLGLAAQYAAQHFFGPKSPPAQASQLETRYGEKLARDIVQGTVGTAGHHIYRNAYGKGNTTVQDVFVLSHWNIAGVNRVRFKGEWKTIGGEVDAQRGQRIQGIDAEIWIKVYTGRMDQAADAGLIAHSNPTGRWTENHRGAGVAYAVITNVLTRDHLPNPWEAFFEVVGVSYDWRRDTSVGGDGAHRYSDPTTWEPTTNPALMAYAATRGFWRGDQKLAGKGRPASALPLAQWTQAANICDEIVVDTQRYQAACILSSGEGVTHDANLQPLLEASAASWIELVGEEYPIVGANQTPVTSFTDDDIIRGEPYRLSMKRTRSELVNTVAGTYVDPESFYQPMPLATRDDAVALAQDRERLAVPLTFSVVTVPACVDRLADIALRASRYQASASICLRHKYLALRPGQWVTWTSARHGWTKTFLVVSKRLGSFGPRNARAVYVSLQEVGEGIFDPTAYVTTPPDGIVQGAPDYLSELQDLVIVGVTVRDPDSGKQYPAIRAAWLPIDDPTVIGVDFIYRPKAQPDVVLPHPTVPDDASLTFMVNGIVSATVFEVAHRLVTSPSRNSPLSAWTEVLTTDSPFNDIYMPGVVDAVSAKVSSYSDFGGYSAREALEQGRQMIATEGASAGHDHMESRRVINEVAVQIDQTRSYVRQEIFVAVGPTSAIALQLNEQRAEYSTGIAANTSLIRTEVSLVNGRVTAVGEQIGVLSAEMAGVSASVTVRSQVVASPGGATVRHAIVLAVDHLGTLVQTGQFYDITDGFGTVGIFSDRFLVVNPNDPAHSRAPLLFEAGVLTLDVGRAREMIVDLAKTPTNKARFGLLAPGVEGLSVTT